MKSLVKVCVEEVKLIFLSFAFFLTLAKLLQSIGNIKFLAVFLCACAKDLCADLLLTLLQFGFVGQCIHAHLLEHGEQSV